MDPIVCKIDGIVLVKFDESEGDVKEVDGMEKRPCVILNLPTTVFSYFLYTASS